MSKIPILRLERPKRLVQQFVGTDPFHPDHEVKLVLKSLDMGDQFLLSEEANKAIVKYITGDVEDEEEAIPFPALGGEMVTVSKSLIYSCAAVLIMQMQPEAERYNMDELIGMSAVMPTLWRELSVFVMKLNSRAAAELQKKGTPSTPPQAD